MEATDVPFLGCCTARPFRGKVTVHVSVARPGHMRMLIVIDHSVDEACANS